jgi:hypothetical protein
MILWGGLVSRRRNPQMRESKMADYAALIRPMVLGYQSGHYAKTIDTRRYDIWLEREQLSNVRLIRFSSSGIFYMEDKQEFVGFVSMSKFIKIVQTLL